MITKMRTMMGAAAVLSACLLATLSCSSDKKAEPTNQSPSAQASGNADGSTTTLVPGEAGGVYEETFNASAIVRAVDVSTRKVTLEAEDGTQVTFSAPAEVRNLDQLRVGDRVKATITEQLLVFVDSDRSAGRKHAAMVARTPKGAKPGALVAQSSEVVGTIKAIDAARRQVTLQFPEGQAVTVPIRKDVDLTRYKVGDGVVVRLNERLSVLVVSP